MAIVELYNGDRLEVRGPKHSFEPETVVFYRHKGKAETYADFVECWYGNDRQPGQPGHLRKPHANYPEDLQKVNSHSAWALLRRLVPCGQKLGAPKVTIADLNAHQTTGGELSWKHRNG